MEYFFPELVKVHQHFMIFGEKRVEFSGSPCFSAALCRCFNWSSLALQIPILFVPNEGKSTFLLLFHTLDQHQGVPVDPVEHQGHVAEGLLQTISLKFQSGSGHM